MSNDLAPVDVEHRCHGLAARRPRPYRCRFSEHRHDNSACRTSPTGWAGMTIRACISKLGRRAHDAQSKSCHPPRDFDQRPLDKDIEAIFRADQSFLNELPDPHFSYRIGRSTKIASNFILASLFYEPSTRTRLSFESAMLRLGARSSPARTRRRARAKGESLADSVRVISNYADIMVIRHPARRRRAARGRVFCDPRHQRRRRSHEHPTQTLCDLFTLKKKNKHLKNLKIAISGDLRGSRTIHSFVYALARFGATIMPMAAKGMELPAHVDQRPARGIQLQDGFSCQGRR